MTHRPLPRPAMMILLRLRTRRTGRTNLDPWEEGMERALYAETAGRVLSAALLHELGDLEQGLGIHLSIAERSDSI